MKLISDWFTERDNTTWCVCRALAFAAGVTMLYKFVAYAGTPDYQNLGVAIAAIGASIAAKNQTEK